MPNHDTLRVGPATEIAPASSSDAFAGARRWQVPSDAFLRSFLAMPELALVPESCAGERRLHDTLLSDPRRSAVAELLAAVVDPEARANHAMYLAFRDALLSAGTLEAYYLAFVRESRIGVPPVFIEKVIAAIVGHLWGRDANPFDQRASQLFYRRQRVASSQGRMLCADAATVEPPGATPEFDLMRMLANSDGHEADSSLPVLCASNVDAFSSAADPYSFVFDLTHEIANDLGHGLTFTMTRAHSGQAALARIIEKWIAHFLGVRSSVQPLQRIDDPAWAWHIGLDVASTALLNDLWHGKPIEPERLKRLLGLFRLEFANPEEMRAEVAGKPVYLGLAMSEGQTLQLKPQNLLVNLPLAASTR